MSSSVSDRLYIPVYAATLLLSAFLLFLVQPMFGKMILPMLGGTPAVWNTAMLFFQSLLLAGYAYAHGTSRFINIKLQAGIHIALLILFAFVLPIAIPDGWVPPTDRDPTFWQLGLMAVVVGGPFFILSGSAPMLQHWFAHTSHKDSGNPYFLYAASNLGSMTALLAYPFVVEPALSVSNQSYLWTFGYVALIALVAGAAILVWTHAEKRDDIRKQAKDSTPITWKMRGTWLLLAFIPSSLMLGVTTFITTDLATVPLLWIIPLTLYISTFIIVFALNPFPSRGVTLKVHGYLLIFLLASLIFFNSEMNKTVLIIVHLAVFFFTALMCHHELASLRPHAGHLTQFYLVMSAGGALGGVFNALIAPNIFVVPVEYGIVLALSCFMRFSSEEKYNIDNGIAYLKEKMKKGIPAAFWETGAVFVVVIIGLCFMSFTYFTNILVSMVAAISLAFILPLFLRRRWLMAFCALVIFCFNPPGYVWGTMVFNEVLHHDRNFFGVVRVVVDSGQETRSLLHGTTIHGNQAIDEKYRLLKLSYYSPFSGVSDAFSLTDSFGSQQRVAVLGLGIGVSACYTKTGRHFDFYEIDPSVIEVAEDPEFFTYLRDCGSPYDIIRGDARLTIQDQPDGHYDMILMDAFSSDNIPVHLITHEALQLYRAKLKKNGFMTINISNRYLDLKPVLAIAAEEMGMTAFGKLTQGGRMEDSGLTYKPAEFVVMTEHESQKRYFRDKGWKELEPVEGKSLWTDQYSNIVSVLKFKDIIRKNK